MTEITAPLTRLNHLVPTMRSFVMFCFHMDAIRDRSQAAAEVAGQSPDVVIDARDLSQKVMVTSAKDALAAMEVAGV